MYLIFVYGSLKKGHWNYERFLMGLEPINAMAPGIELHQGPGFPYAKYGEAITIGEVYEVTKEQLEDIDRMEGINCSVPHYSREKIDVTVLETGKVLQTWIYLSEFNAGKYPVIESGVWEDGR